MVFAEGNGQSEYEQKHVYSGLRYLQGKISEFVDSVDWERVAAGTMKGAGAVIILVIGVAAVVATGGAALPAVLELIGGTVTASTAVVTVATLATGIASVAFGLADVLEALQDLHYGLSGSSNASFNPLRDTLFAGNEDMYYGIETAVTGMAGAGTATFYSYNMESEIDAAEIARYEKNSSFESSSVVKGNLKGSLNKLTTDERTVVNNLLKTLNGASLNTPVKRITEGFKQGASTIIIDGRKTGITMQEAETVVNRTQGKLGKLPGTVEIWTNDGIFTR